MALIEITPPVLEPVTLSQAKDHCRITHAKDDSIVEPLITTARLHVEGKLHRRLLTQTLDYVIDWFPRGMILLPVAPLISVTSITYIDADGVLQTLAATEYQVDAVSEQSRIAEDVDKTWPDTQAQKLNAVTIRVVVGYGANPEDVPADIRSAILIAIEHWYNHRDIVVVGASVTPVPMTVNALLMPHVFG